MPLPAADIPWPPVNLMAMYTKMSEWAAWYSGDPERIMGAYVMQSAIQSQGTGVPWWRFWSRARAGKEGAQRALLHVPLASDLAATSGALLFGEPPTIRVRAARALPDDPTEDKCPQCGMDQSVGKMAHPAEPHTLADVLAGSVQMGEMIKPKAKPQTPEEKAEERLLKMVEEGGVYARLAMAAESAAAIGGVYIYPVWDKDLRPFPIMGVAQSDMAVPEWKHGYLTAVTFHRTVQGEGNRVLRLLERHEVEGTGPTRKCVILSALYSGTEDRLGVQVNLGVGDTWGDAPPPPDRVELPFDELDVEYVPNILPNRLWRASNMGIADIQGSESLLDALDETYASWMRDVRLAKARILVPREYLRPDPDSTSGQPSFDLDQEIYVGMDMEPGMTASTQSMLAHQFQIRYEEHDATASALIDRIVSNAGYAPTTLGADAKGKSASGIRVTEHKTLLTLRKKGGWWRHAIANTLYRMQVIDKEFFDSGIEPIKPSVLTADSIIDNPLELAQTAMALRTAQAASTETLVRIVHPDWSEGEVQAECDRIEDDKPATPPSIGGGAFGDPSQDPSATSKHPMSPDNQAAPPKPGAPAAPPSLAGGHTPPPQVGAKPLGE
jgi:hypothetical protein